MKQMKKVVLMLMTSLLIFSFTACGGSDSKTKTTVLTYAQDNITMEFKLISTDDIVETLIQKCTTDCSAYSEEQLLSFKNSIFTLYEGIEGVTYTAEISGTDLVETLEIDATNTTALQTLSQKGLLSIKEGTTSISREKTIENLKAQGWTVK